MSDQERIRFPRQWWNQLIHKLNLPKTRADELLALGIELSDKGEVSLLSPEGERVRGEFTRIGFKKVVAYQAGIDNGVPVLRYFQLPDVPNEVITRMKHFDKRKWGSVEEN